MRPTHVLASGRWQHPPVNAPTSVEVSLLKSAWYVLVVSFDLFSAVLYVDREHWLTAKRRVESDQRGGPCLWF